MVKIRSASARDPLGEEPLDPRGERVIERHVREDPRRGRRRVAGSMDAP